MGLENEHTMLAHLFNHAACALFLFSVDAMAWRLGVQPIMSRAVGSIILLCDARRSGSATQCCWHFRSAAWHSSLLLLERHGTPSCVPYSRRHLTRTTVSADGGVIAAG
jgi:hypothetical protein